ncbi:hypothetical protein PHYBLDRAFT_59486 [Phycomyces blakesleeanus NRRL 1555(-)]|uniref:Uncharacterized protein n=1 Tax=Phycomyces blakesleeanus (strain ATCC 8743b / DSM 1359 / FGSC 10004 / NBRC 33097 / NRRL 1555) TaxID=763407 RepID=A0A167NI51_PHYB8|nr:hypothetical protein PHYBLDRAFT_59486 [Phycomyces blakesleeanus NRRL 1555(-)]OAD75959.1 hypothetical protein PHYBLDRAFT_59486 [Phycomyces blakesleeanus NRRL 1555(-)]|eukprot:XP_018293999.1 hypothetical protein PHYBLDRAFT_59486 [Phycomyces blakesleeanus NRRL 1555(-)]
MPTFSWGTQMSSIDYIFATPDIAALKHKSAIDYINPAWSDHFLVSTNLSLRTSLKRQLSIIQQETVKILAMRAQKHWRENGERSARYLKRTILANAIRKDIPFLRHPTSEALCTTPSTMTNVAMHFYEKLYTVDPIENSSVEDLLNHVPPKKFLSEATRSSMTPLLTFDNICPAVNCSPNHSSPGPDGLPYKILSLLFCEDRYSTLLTNIYNDALNKGVFPSSWSFTCLSLLPKKGDLSSLKNWRLLH